MKVRYFAWLRQRTGCAAEEVDLPSEVTDVRSLMEWLGQKHPRFGEIIDAQGVVRCAVNQEYAESDQLIKASDEIAFFPPVTGG